MGQLPLGFMVWIPLALIGLLGVVALIIIYILKPKFQEKPVSSTFVWKLSLKYARKKVPFEWLTGSLILIIQIIMLTLLAFMMTSPLFIRPTDAREQIIIIDASAHMLAETNGQSRFDRAWIEADNMGSNASPSTPVTIILGTRNPRAIVMRETRPAYVNRAMRDAEVSATFGTMNMQYAMDIATTILEQNPDAEITLFTARNFDDVDTGDVTIRNVDNGEWNAAILGLTYDREHGLFNFVARVATFGRDADLTLELFVDTEDGESGIRRFVSTTNNEETIVRWSLGIANFTTARVEIVEIDGDPDLRDSFPYDDYFYIQAAGAYLFDIQLVSPAPDFLRNALQATGLAARITVAPLIDPEEPLTGTINDFRVETSGFHLHVFDTLMPLSEDQMPRDGVVWFINPTTAVPGRGVFPRIPAPIGTIEGSRLVMPASVAPDASSIVREAHETMIEAIPEWFFAGILPYEFRPRITRMSNIEEDFFIPLLMAGDRTALGLFYFDEQRYIYMPFSLHYSTLPLNILPLLLHGMMEFSLIPRSVDTILTVESPIQIYWRPNVEYITVGLQGATHRARNTTGDAFSYMPTRPGRFTIEYNIPGVELPSIDYFFVRVSASESNFLLRGSTIMPPTVIGSGTGRPPAAEAPIDILFWLAIALLVFINLEWFLNHRESA